MPSSLLSLVDYLGMQKDVNLLSLKLKDIMQKFEQFCFAGTSMETILVPLDEFGEFLTEPFVHQIKDAISQIMTEIRKFEDMAI